MSKLIVEMEMPKSCAKCPLVDDSERCIFLGTFASDKTNRLPKCPIKGELPEQHGDLIDRDELKKRCWTDDGFDLWVSHTEIDEQPTVIAAERKDDEQIH